MTKRCRIEITAFRRATIVFRAQSGLGSSTCSPPESGQAEPIGILSPLIAEVGLVEAETPSVDVARSPELTLLIEALLKNDGDSKGAASQLGLSHGDFISKLCGIGFSVK